MLFILLSFVGYLETPTLLNTLLIQLEFACNMGIHKLWKNCMYCKLPNWILVWAVISCNPPSLTMWWRCLTYSVLVTVSEHTSLCSTPCLLFPSCLCKWFGIWCFLHNLSGISALVQLPMELWWVWSVSVSKGVEQRDTWPIPMWLHWKNISHPLPWHAWNSSRNSTRCFWSVFEAVPPQTGEKEIFARPEISGL